MSAPPLTADLTNWATKCGYAYTPDHGPGAALLWSTPGGEIRYLVRRTNDGHYVLTSSERNAPEQFELLGRSIEVVERHLYASFGTSLRSKMNMSLAVVSPKNAPVAPGFTLGAELDAEGYRTLSDAEGLVAKAKGRLSSISVLTDLSYLLSSSTQEIKRSFEDPRGRPLLHEL